MPLAEIGKFMENRSRDCCSGGSVTLCKGGDDMVTYADLFEYSLVIIGVITLCLLYKR